jgi:hypothetical protein
MKEKVFDLATAQAVELDVVYAGYGDDVALWIDRDPDKEIDPNFRDVRTTVRLTPEEAVDLANRLIDAAKDEERSELAAELA